jgi:hypothetical protein
MKNREVKLHIERRKNAGQVIKPEKAFVDAFALVESRSGVVVRWFFEEANAIKELERIKNRG